MKKIVVLFSLLAATMSLSAQGYQHSIGIDVGTLYGLSYKAFIFPTVPELALQIDGGINIFATGGTAIAKVSDFESGLTVSKNTQFGRMQVYDLVLHPNVVYQKEWAQYDWGVLSWYAGGGFNIGYMRQNSKAYDYNTGQYDYFPLMIGLSMRGKFGLDAVGGLEMLFKDAPLALSVDFRPGYGTGWGWEKYDDYQQNINLHYFDWTLAIGLRYCIPQKTTK